jgi:hypothetical protein
MPTCTSLPTARFRAEGLEGKREHVTGLGTAPPPISERAHLPNYNDLVGEAVFSELRAAFGFVEQRGFHVTKARRLRVYAGGYELIYESDRVRVEIIVDSRGEVDALLALRDRPDEALYLCQFVEELDPIIQRPPLMFGGGTRRERAFQILSDLLATHAHRALEGDEEAFARAARTPDDPPRVLP